jgi:hypothetical protein
MMGCTKDLTAPKQALITASTGVLPLLDKKYKYLSLYVYFSLLRQFADLHKIVVDIACSLARITLVFCSAANELPTHSSRPKLVCPFKGASYVQRT